MEIGTVSNLATGMQKTAENKQPVPIATLAGTKPVPVETTNAVQEPAAAPSLDQVKEALQNINQSMHSLSQGLEFSIDTDSNRTVVKVIDQQTQEVIRQMPSQEALDIAKMLDQVLGKLIREKA